MPRSARPLRVVVTGAAGQLGGFLLPALVLAGYVPIGFGARPGPGIDRVVDIADPAAAGPALRAVAPDAVIHAAAFTDVDGCERDPAKADAVNARGSRHVAEAACAVGAYVLSIGTDFVFSGDGGAPYAEDASPSPVSVYGATKLAGERAVLAVDPAFAVARTAWLFGGPGKHFPRTVVDVLRRRGGVEVVTDEVGNPTFAGDLATALVHLLDRRGGGIFHLTNAGAASRFDLARAVAGGAGFDPDLVRPTTSAAFLAKHPLPARRPADSRLVNGRAAAIGIAPRSWQEAVAEYAPRLAAGHEAQRSAVVAAGRP